MNITKKLDIWEQEKLITAAQQKAILKFEMRHKSPLFLYSLLFLSSFCIGLGIIALIASNWQIIPASAKLGVDFLLLASLGGGTYYAYYHNRNFLREALLILYAIMLLASIGLVSQIFQLPSNGLQALLFWSVIISPLLLFSKQIWLSFVWLPTLIISLFDFLNDFSWFNQSIEKIKDAIPGGLPFLLILLFAIIYRMLANSRTVTHPISRAFRWWTMLLIIFYVILTDFFGRDILFNNHHSIQLMADGANDVLKLCFWLSMAVLTGSFCQFNRYNGGKFWSLTLFIILNFLLITQFLPENRILFEIWGALQTISVLALVGVYAYGRGLSGLLNWVSGLMALRFFVIYIQAFGSLLTTGLGLITSGLVFLAISYGWCKFKGRILTSVKGVK